VHDEKMMHYLLDLFGPNQLALGSDYPFPLGEHHPGKLIETIGLDATIQERLLNGTALEWLGLEKTKFL
jgi:aminocarboxymuconate-semialdehyde decarboxylase